MRYSVSFTLWRATPGGGRGLGIIGRDWNLLKWSGFKGVSCLITDGGATKGPSGTNLERQGLPSQHLSAELMALSVWPPCQGQLPPHHDDLQWQTLASPLKRKFQEGKAEICRGQQEDHVTGSTLTRGGGVYPSELKMVLHLHLFPSASLQFLNDLSWKLIFPCYWLLDHLVASFVSTTQEKRQCSQDPCASLTPCVLLSTPLYLLLIVLWLPFALLGFLVWAPLQTVRRPYLYSHRRVNGREPQREWKPQGRSYCFSSANVCLLPDALSRVNNLSDTQGRAREVGRRICNGATRPQIKIYIDSPTNSSVSANSFSSLGLQQGAGISQVSSTDYKPVEQQEGRGGPAQQNEECGNTTFLNAHYTLQDNTTFLIVHYTRQGNTAFPNAQYTLQGNTAFLNAHYTLQGNTAFPNAHYTLQDNTKSLTAPYTLQGNISLTGNAPIRIAPYTPQSSRACLTAPCIIPTPEAVPKQAKAVAGGKGSPDSCVTSQESLTRVHSGNGGVSTNSLSHHTSALTNANGYKPGCFNGSFDHEISAFFPANLDFLCLQEVFDKQAEVKLRRELHSYFPFILSDVGRYAWKGCCSRFKCLNSGLLFASRYPILDADYYCYPNGQGEDALAAKGVLCAKVLLGKSPNDQRIVGYIALEQRQLLIAARKTPDDQAVSSH
ncbi:hypothetical protein JZ751_021040 [Albula glossodonta]|uniref:sphingomyelin phosphodiesterase n=1 Tax=Albula glossodonta TaxID=121402 RepID=A0A8T2PKZ9_9TELE|nr:hypothetical protein JZ751_021040 [Albula glossodonta]